MLEALEEPVTAPELRELVSAELGGDVSINTVAAYLQEWSKESEVPVTRIARGRYFMTPSLRPETPRGEQPTDF